MNGFRQKIAEFMRGRYGGNDTLNKWLLGFFIFFFLLSALTGWNFFYLVGLTILVYSYFRMLSRNISKRAEENQKFIRLISPVQNRMQRFFRRQKQKKTHRIFSCPGCSQKIRIPKGKGNVEITCPKCNTLFTRRT